MKKKCYNYPTPNPDFNYRGSRVAVQDVLLELSSTQNEDNSYTICNDITLLFSQQRLDNKFSPEELRRLFDKYTPQKSVYKNRMPDDLLMSTMKSRHIQSLSEVRAWTEYCMEEFKDLIESYERQQDEEQSQVVGQSASDGASDSPSE